MCVTVYVWCTACPGGAIVGGMLVLVGGGGGGGAVVLGGEWVQDAVLSSNDALLDALNNSNMYMQEL
jgi:hypothetical protein